MRDGIDPPAQSPPELASRIDEQLESCRNVVEHYRGLLRKRRHKPKSGD